MLRVVIIVPAAAVVEDREEPDHGHDGTRARRQQAGIPFHPLPVVRPMPDMSVPAPRIGHRRPQCLEIDRCRFLFHLPGVRRSPGPAFRRNAATTPLLECVRQRSVRGTITWEGAKDTSAMPIPQLFPFREAVARQRRVPCGLPRDAGFRWRSAYRVWPPPRVPGQRLSFRRLT
jgi:hypothetical protein